MAKNAQTQDQVPGKSEPRTRRRGGRRRGRGGAGAPGVSLSFEVVGRVGVQSGALVGGEEFVAANLAATKGAAAKTLERLGHRPLGGGVVEGQLFTGEDGAQGAYLASFDADVGFAGMV